MYEQLRNILMWATVIGLSVTVCACLLRAILGPRFTDRVVSVNLISTKTIIIITALSLLLEQDSLVDVALVYAMISFLAVVVLSKCYLLPHHPNPADAGKTAPTEEEEPEIHNQKKSEHGHLPKRRNKHDNT